MTTHSKLGPFTTLILNLTTTGTHVASVASSQPARAVNHLLLTQLLIALLKTKPVGHARPSARVFRIGSAQACRVSS